MDLVATSGHRLLGDYRFDPRTGLRGTAAVRPNRRRPWPRVRYDADARLGLGERPPPVGEDALAGYLRQARQFLATGPDRVDGRPSRLPADLEALRDFHLSAAYPPDTERSRGSFFMAAIPHRGS